MLKIFLIILAFLLTFSGVEMFRRWSVRREILDFPNERSSHTTPTPVGGGLVIVLVCLLLFLIYLYIYNHQIPWAYLIGAITISIISWLDDLFSISVIVRFLFHGFAAFLVIFSFGSFTGIYIPLAGDLSLDWLSPPLMFFWIVWMINAYNFMDGIDGIAGVQAITAGFGWFFVAYQLGLETTGFYSLILVASANGFILLNWQPAKIFMGDVGSAFLGYTFAVIPLLAKQESPTHSSIFFLIGILFLWMFVFDTLVTVGIRIFQKKKVWQPHREHLYQQLIIRGYSHRFVALFYGICSVAVLILTKILIFSEKKIEIYAVIAVILISVFVFVFGRKDNISKMLT